MNETVKNLLEQGKLHEPDSKELFEIIKDLEVVQAEIVKSNCIQIKSNLNRLGLI